MRILAIPLDPVDDNRGLPLWAEGESWEVIKRDRLINFDYSTLRIQADVYSDFDEYRPLDRFGM